MNRTCRRSLSEHPHNATFQGFYVNSSCQRVKCSPLCCRMLFPECQRQELTEELLRSADVDPTLRPTEISISEFRALADAYSKLCEENQGLVDYEFREELKLKHQAKRDRFTFIPQQKKLLMGTTDTGNQTL